MNGSSAGIRLMRVGSIMLALFSFVGVLMSVNGLFISQRLDDERPLIVYGEFIPGAYDEFGSPIPLQRSWRPFHIVTLPLCAFALLLGWFCRKHQENLEKAKLILMLAILNAVVLVAWRMISGPLYYGDIHNNVIANLRLVTIIIVASIITATGAFKNMQAFIVKEDKPECMAQ